MSLDPPPSTCCEGLTGTLGRVGVGVRGNKLVFGDWLGSDSMVKARWSPLLALKGQTAVSTDTTQKISTLHQPMICHQACKTRHAQEGKEA